MLGTKPKGSLEQTMGTRMTPDFWKVPSVVLRIYFTPEPFNNKLPRWCTICFPQKLEYAFFVNKDSLLHNHNITIKIRMLALDCLSSDPIRVSPVQIISRITKRFHSEPWVALVIMYLEQFLDLFFTSISLTRLKVTGQSFWTRSLNLSLSNVFSSEIRHWQK